MPKNNQEKDKEVNILFIIDISTYIHASISLTILANTLQL